MSPVGMPRDSDSVQSHPLDIPSTHSSPASQSSPARAPPDPPSIPTEPLGEPAATQSPQHPGQPAAVAQSADSRAAVNESAAGESVPVGESSHRVSWFDTPRRTGESLRSTDESARTTGDSAQGSDSPQGTDDSATPEQAAPDSLNRSHQFHRSSVPRNASFAAKVCAMHPHCVPQIAHMNDLHDSTAGFVRLLPRLGSKLPGCLLMGVARI